MTASALSSGGQQPGQVLRPVRAVGVHLDDHVVAVLQRPAEAGDVGAAEARLLCPVHDLDVRVGLRELVGEVPGAVGAVIVDHQQVRVGDGFPDPAGDDLQVLPLVVRRHDDDHAPSCPGRVLRPGRLFHSLSSPSLSGNVSGREPGQAPSVRIRLVGHEHGLRCLLSRPGPFQAQPLTAGHCTGPPAVAPGFGDWLSPPPLGAPTMLRAIRSSRRARCWNVPKTYR